MNEFILYTEQKADIPYVIQPEGLPVYTLSELCYFLQEHLFLMNDQEFIGEALCEWIHTQLHLNGLYSRLVRIRRGNNGGYRCAMQIFEESGIYSNEELADLRRMLQTLAGKTDMEKQKVLADYLLKQGKYRQALYIYLDLLKESSVSRMTDDLHAQICYNAGVVYARCLVMKEAAAQFQRAWELSGQEAAKKACQNVTALSERENLSAFLQKKAGISGKELSLQTGDPVSGSREESVKSALKEDGDYQKIFNYFLEEYERELS